MTETAWTVIRIFRAIAPSNVLNDFESLFVNAPLEPLNAIQKLAAHDYEPIPHVLAVLSRYRPFERQAFIRAIRRRDEVLADRCEAGEIIESFSLEQILKVCVDAVVVDVLVKYPLSKPPENLLQRGRATNTHSFRLGIRKALAACSEEFNQQQIYDRADKLFPDRRGAIASECLRSPIDAVLNRALDTLEKLGPKQVGRMIIEALPHCRTSTLLDRVKSRWPGLIMEAVEASLASRNAEQRIRAINILESNPELVSAERLNQLAGDSDWRIRQMALELLGPTRGRKAALAALDDPTEMVKVTAIGLLEQDEDPLLLDVLLPLARDGADGVRATAIKALARFDDPRVLSELVSSLNDKSSAVVQTAREILEGPAEATPVLRQYQDDWQPIHEQLLDQVKDINAWSCDVGQELLGVPVRVHQYREGVGRTQWRRRRQAVDIEVSDTPITSLHPEGETIMKAVALHEIGHHLCDIGVRGSMATRGIARSEGLGDVYDILLDERLERSLRSRRPEWGKYFDRLTSYAFAQKTHRVKLEDYARLVDQTPEQTAEAIRGGDLPGQLTPGADGEPRVLLRTSDMLGIPKLVPPLLAFLWCLRSGYDPKLCADPGIARAIAEIPANLKDLPHSEVLETTRRIGRIIGHDKDHKRRMKRFREQMRQLREQLRDLVRSLQEDLDRMAETGQTPDWLKSGTEGIRRTPDSQGRPGPRGQGGPPREFPRIKLKGRGRRKNRRTSRGKEAGGQNLNLGPELDFDPLPEEESLAFDFPAHALLAAQIRKHIRRLRAYFERLGYRTVDEYASRRGRRIDIVEARKTAAVPSANLLVHSREEIEPDAYVGLLIDRSGSMQGDRIELAKTFGVLLAEAAGGLRGIEGNVSAFDDDTFYQLGSLRRNAIASLQAGGGNNDAGGLERAADLALRSGKSNRLVIMISDGSPTECTVQALDALVKKLTRDYKIVCAQVAVESIEHVTFPHHVDLSKYSFDESVTRFGRLLVKLTTGWRS